MANFEFLKNRLSIFSGDLFGGINAAVIALPQALAFGVATGFGAGAGVWGAIILCLVAGIFGTRVPMIAGITGPVAIVIASIMHSLNQDISSVIFIILIAGLLQLILAFTKLPDIVKYVPYPVISGFMNGVGTIIIIMQLNPLFGLKPFSNTIESIKNLFLTLHFANPEALILGVLTLLIVFFTPKAINKIVPSQILALIVCTVLSVKMGFNVDKISTISAAFPQIQLPHTTIHDFVRYFHYAIMLGIILSSETLLTGLVCSSITKQNIQPKKLLIPQGIGNMLCAFTGVLPGSAATMRTVAAIKTGASTKGAAIISAVVLMLCLSIFSGFVAQIPLPVLAGILIKIGYDIIDFKLLKVLKYAPKDDKYVLGVVFFLTVFYNLIAAVGAGIVLAALLYAKGLADRTKIVQTDVYDSDIQNMERMVEKDFKHKIRVVHISGQFFFGSATQLVSHFDEMLGTKFIVLVYDSDVSLDISAIFALEDIILRLKSQHIKLLLVINNEEIREQLVAHDIISQLGENHIFYSEIRAIDYAKGRMQRKLNRELEK